jgi:hypothetical protein
MSRTIKILVLVCYLTDLARFGLAEYGLPEQVHLSYGGKKLTLYISKIYFPILIKPFAKKAEPDKMIVTWVTQDAVDESTVEYGYDNEEVQKQNGTSGLFVDGGREKRKITIHRVLLSDLKPGKIYCTTNFFFLNFFII